VFQPPQLLRSSVVSVLNSLTTITRAPPSVFGYLIFAAPVLRALLATRGRDDLATAVPACVVAGFDMGCETIGAYRGAGYLVKLTCKLIVANEDNYALAA